MLASKDLVSIIVQEIEDTKGIEIKVLDLKGRTNFADYFVIATGSSDRHVKAMADKVELRLKKDYQELPLSFEGYDSGEWVLMDYGDVVLHLFQEEARAYYDLEGFWA